jgi:hypothetical protein
MFIRPFRLISTPFSVRALGFIVSTNSIQTRLPEAVAHPFYDECWPDIVQEGSRAFKRVQEGSSGFKRVQEGPRGSKKVQDDSNSFMWVKEGSLGFIIVIIGSRWFQGYPWRIRQL